MYPRISALVLVLFRSVLRVLLENLEDEDGSTRALVFGVLTEMLKQVYTFIYLLFFARFKTRNFGVFSKV